MGKACNHIDCMYSNLLHVSHSLLKEKPTCNTPRFRKQVGGVSIKMAVRISRGIYRLWGGFSIFNTYTEFFHLTICMRSP